MTFAGAALLWWAYFDFAGVGGEGALDGRPEDAREMARDVYTFCHFPMIAGIILFAVSAKKTVAHPGDVLSTAGRFALAAGIALYMLGFVGARWRTIGALAWERIAAAATVPLLVLALREADALLVMAAALVLLGAWIAVEAWRLGPGRALHLGCDQPHAARCARAGRPPRPGCAPPQLGPTEARARSPRGARRARRPPPARAARPDRGRR